MKGYHGKLGTCERLQHPKILQLPIVLLDLWPDFIGLYDLLGRFLFIRCD